MCQLFKSQYTISTLKRRVRVCFIAVSILLWSQRYTFIKLRKRGWQEYSCIFIGNLFVVVTEVDDLLSKESFIWTAKEIKWKVNENVKVSYVSSNDFYLCRKPTSKSLIFRSANHNVSLESTISISKVLSICVRTRWGKFYCHTSFQTHIIQIIYST